LRNPGESGHVFEENVGKRHGRENRPETCLIGKKSSSTAWLCRGSRKKSRVLEEVNLVRKKTGPKMDPGKIKHRENKGKRKKQPLRPGRGGSKKSSRRAVTDKERGFGWRTPGN